MTVNKRHQRGFTLIEIALVLVVVGLVVAGVVAGYNLLSGTKTKTFIRQVSQVDALRDQFTSKFRSIPGDSSKYYDRADSDGMIEDWNGYNATLDSVANGTGATFTGEVANFWVALQESGAVNDGNTYVATVDGKLKVARGATNVPPTKIGVQGTGIVAVNDFKEKGMAGGLRGKNIAGVYLVGKMDEMEASTRFDTGMKDAFTPLEVATIELKIDDRKADSGNILALSNNGKCANGSNYNTAETEPSCWTAVAFDTVTPQEDTVPTNPACNVTCGSNDCGATVLDPDSCTCVQNTDKQAVIDACNAEPNKEWKTFPTCNCGCKTPPVCVEGEEILPSNPCVCVPKCPDCHTRDPITEQCIPPVKNPQGCQLLEHWADRVGGNLYCGFVPQDISCEVKDSNGTVIQKGTWNDHTKNPACQCIFVACPDGCDSTAPACETCNEGTNSCESSPGTCPSGKQLQTGSCTDCECTPVTCPQGQHQEMTDCGCLCGDNTVPDPSRTCSGGLTNVNGCCTCTMTVSDCPMEECPISSIGPDGSCGVNCAPIGVSASCQCQYDPVCGGGGGPCEGTCGPNQTMNEETCQCECSNGNGPGSCSPGLCTQFNEQSCECEDINQCQNGKVQNLGSSDCECICPSGKIDDGNDGCCDPDPTNPTQCKTADCGDKQCTGPCEMVGPPPNCTCASVCDPFSQKCELGLCVPKDPCNGMNCQFGCEDGKCLPDPCDALQCPHGCSDGQCLQDPCSSLTCDFGCEDGTCLPDPCSILTCEFGCVDGACQPDPCEGFPCGCGSQPACEE